MYEVSQEAAADALSSSGSAAFTPQVIDTILSLTAPLPGDTGPVTMDTVAVPTDGIVTVEAGTDLVFITSSDTIRTSIVAPADVPVLIFQGSGGVDVVIGSGGADIDSHADRVIVGSAGDDRFVIQDGRDTHVVLGTGNSTVVAGSGDDTILAGLGNATIDGGLGDDVVRMQGHASDYVLAANATLPTPTGGSPLAASTSHVVITHAGTGVTTDLTGLQYVALDDGDALIVAATTVEAGVAALYHAAFGRTGEADGIDYWFDKAKAGEGLAEIAVEFTHSAEYAATAALSDGEFVTRLYQNTFGREPEAGGLAYWLGQLDSGASRAAVMTQFASVAALNIDGSLHTEATVVGTVAIVHDIV